MRLAGVAMLGVVISVAGLMMGHRSDLPASAPFAAFGTTTAATAGHTGAVAAAPAQGAQGAPRRVYPYSIVPGGVVDRADLERVIKRDRTAAAHYAGFQVDKAVPVTVAKARAVYVSYRKDGQVYWTSKKVMLGEGETLLSDGTNEIRTRCGNRISETRRLPVAANEPAPEVLDTAMDAEDDGEGGVQPVSMPLGDNGPGGVGPTHVASVFASGSGLIMVDNGRPLSLIGLPGPSAPRGIDGAGTPIALSAPQVARTAQNSPGSLTNTSAAVAPARGSGVGGTGTRTPGATDDGSATGGAVTPVGSDPVSGNAPDLGTTPLAPTDPLAGGVPPVPTNGDVTVPSKPQLPPLPGELAPAVPTAPAKPNDVPEPGSLWLSGIALAAMALLRRKQRPRR